MSRAVTLFRSGRLVVVVEGTRSRVVPVLVRYQEMLALCAGFSGDAYMVGGFAPQGRTSPLLCSPGQTAELV
jgi:hypothetical protein